MKTFPGQCPSCRRCGHPAAQAVIQSPASHCTGLDSIPGQAMWMLWRTKFHRNTFLSKIFIFPVSIIPLPLHSRSCIYHQRNITSAQHNFLVNTVVSQTLLQSFPQNSPLVINGGYSIHLPNFPCTKSKQINKQFPFYIFQQYRGAIRESLCLHKQHLRIGPMYKAQTTHTHTHSTSHHTHTTHMAHHITHTHHTYIHTHTTHTYTHHTIHTSSEY